MKKTKRLFVCFLITCMCIFITSIGLADINMKFLQPKGSVTYEELYDCGNDDFWVSYTDDTVTLWHLNLVYDYEIKYVQEITGSNTNVEVYEQNYSCIVEPPGTQPVPFSETFTISHGDIYKNGSVAKKTWEWDFDSSYPYDLIYEPQDDVFAAACYDSIEVLNPNYVKIYYGWDTIDNCNPMVYTPPSLYVYF